MDDVSIIGLNLNDNIYHICKEVSVLGLYHTHMLSYICICLDVEREVLAIKVK